MVRSTDRLDTVILYCLKQINGERSLYSIFHLLKGKKSSQTIQDAHLFQMRRFFYTYPFLTREKLILIARKLKNKQWVTEISEEYFSLTSEGNQALGQLLNESPFPKYLDGWNYHTLTDVFWERLSLLVQVCSNLIQYKTEYYPIQQKHDTQTWLKNFLQHSLQTRTRNQLSQQLYNEIVTIFEEEHSIDPAVLVSRLTGADRIGLTAQQAANYLRLEFSDYHILFLNCLHYMINRINKDDGQYPLLKSCINDVTEHSTFTISTEKTYQLLKKGLSIDEISTIRKLKRSTIEDHVVEIALIDKTFDIVPYVNQVKQNKILAAANRANSRKLKQIKILTDDVNYFEIRLVIAKFGENK